MEDNKYEYELPPENNSNRPDYVSNASTATGSMIDPNGKNMYTWVIGILLLLCVSAGSLLVGIYENILAEKDEKIKLLEDRDCIKELRKSLQLQAMLHSELQKVTELKEETEEKANNLLDKS